MRLFVAIELSDRVRSVLADVQASLGATSHGIRWIPRDRMHLTLKFLGDVPDRDVDGVAKAVRSVAKELKGFDMEIAGAGCFPPRGPVRIVWAGLQEKSGTLAECAKQLDQGLHPLGFPQELRPFSPHLTLARLRHDDSDGALRTAVEKCTYSPVTQAVSKLTLMSSVLSRKGPTYAPICSARFSRI
ncbi:MAG: RNA 2',3'-cyclic phosphodiesterase [Planctomycetes bacterium]|nr:RNA 2',3'-cyclic phosphodiesterase [Planctomycetota bacterium]